MRLTKLFTLLLVSGSIGVIAGATGCGGGGGGTAGNGGAAGSGGNGGAAGSGGTAGGGGSEAFPCTPQCEATKDVKSDCVAIVNNEGQATYGLRMAQLSISQPPALASLLISNVIDSGVTMNLPDCNLSGEGSFSWLLQFDTASGKLKTGGAKPATDPTAGYCFVNEAINMIQVSPITVDAKPGPDGKFSVAMGADVVVPIFSMAAGTILLPLKKARLLDGVVSADQNCIGSHNDETLTTKDNCEVPGERFTNGASLDAYITLEDADTVDIESASLSLCALLTNENDGAPMGIKHCKRDQMTMKITSKGDWCDATNMAADATCADSFKLGAKFAASAVKVNGDCQ